MSALRSTSLRAITRSKPITASSQTRWLHGNRAASPIPQPIPLVPDVATFLKVIGRGMKQHAEKFPSWESLFSLTSPELKELGIEPPRNRKYLLQWLQRFRQGQFGPGGDFKYVHDGEARLKVTTTATGQYRDAKWVVNVPPEATSQAEDIGVKVDGYTVRGARAIAGPFALPSTGGDGASVKVTDGMWEHKRGRKIDGGERRRAEIRFKRRVAQRKAEREAEYQ